jgi:hypothetical protein
MLIKLNQMHDSPAYTSCGTDPQVALLKVLSEQLENYCHSKDPFHYDIGHIHQQLPPIHQAILRCDVLAVENMALIRYRSLKSDSCASVSYLLTAGALA